MNENYCLRYPKLYEPGLKNILFNKKLFSWSVAEGVVSSLVLFFIPYGTYLTGVDPMGKDVTDTQSLGTIVAAALVLTVNVRVSLDVNSLFVLFLMPYGTCLVSRKWRYAICL